jgi:hypothetical protein
MMESDQEADSPRRPLIGEHESRLDVGRRYLAVLVRDHRAWGPIGTATMTLDEAGTVTSRVIAKGPVAGSAALRGLSVAEAGHRLGATSPLPGARRFARLPPGRRYQRMAR